jgi:glycosyltransferase involved in cell wall biosynthesis
MLKDNQNIKFLIGGKGPLQSNVEMALKEIDRDFPGRIKYLGWIPHHELPLHLNEIRLLVIPSYSEGLPNIMLESMACGTPVLAMPVGAIPDVISDNVNGFLLDTNSAEGIARGVMKCMSNQKIDGISANARKFVEDHYSYQSALIRYTEVLKCLEEQ